MVFSNSSIFSFFPRNLEYFDNFSSILLFCWSVGIITFSIRDRRSFCCNSSIFSLRYTSHSSNSLFRSPTSSSFGSTRFVYCALCRSEVCQSHTSLLTPIFKQRRTFALNISYELCRSANQQIDN